MSHPVSRTLGLWILALCTAAAAVARASDDRDGDGVPDASDNCPLVRNVQLDVDGDGFGNACDADFDGDGIVGFRDFSGFADRFWCTSRDACWDELAAACDLDGDGVVGVSDWPLMVRAYARPVGPSGLGCAGRAPCHADVPLPALPVVQVPDYVAVPDAEEIAAALAACAPGCNLRFLVGVYDDVAITVGDYPAGFSMSGFGRRLTALRSPIFGSDDWAPLIQLDSAAPPGIRIRDLRLDGRADDQRPPQWSNGRTRTKQISRHWAIRGQVQGLEDRSGGVVRDLEIHDFVEGGIWIDKGMDHWSVVDNHVHDLGCHQVDAPCGERLPPPNPWNDAATEGDGDNPAPALKATGQGILLTGGHHVLVQGNRVERATKIGIETFMLPGPQDVWIVGNVADGNRSGIVLNGGSDLHVVNNVVRNGVYSGGETEATADGFRCGNALPPIEWVGNLAEDNQRSGFALGCTAVPEPGQPAEVRFIGNRSRDNCRGSTDFAGELNLSGLGREDAPLQVRNFVAATSGDGGSSCRFGLGMRGVAGADVRDVVLYGDFQFGVFLHEVQHTEVRDSTIATTHPDASEVRFDEGDAPLRDVTILPSVRFYGFREPVMITGSSQVDESVSHCGSEAGQGCAP